MESNSNEQKIASRALDALLATLINQLGREMHFLVDPFMGQQIIDNVNQERRISKEEKLMSFILEILLFPFKIIGWMLKLVITIPLMILAMLFGELMKPQKKNRYGRF